MASLLRQLLADPAESRYSVLDHPPNGAWYRRTEDGFVVGVSKRSPIAVLLVFPLCFAWLVCLDPKVHPGPYSLAEIVLFSCLQLASVYVLGLNYFGKLEIRRNGDLVSIFNGWGRLGRTNYVRWSQVTSIHEELIQMQNRHRRWAASVVVLEGPTKITLGQGLTLERIYFLNEGLNILKREDQ